MNDIAASEGGAMSVLKEFYQEILDSNDDNEWIFLLGDYYIENTPNIKVYSFPKIKKNWFQRLYFDFFYGRKIVNNFNPDMYVSLQNSATLGIHCKQLVYLHQPLPYQNEKNFSFFKKKETKFAIYQKIIGKLYDLLFRLSNCQIIVQTEWMKNAVKRRVKNKVVKIQIQIPVSDVLTSKNNRNNFHFFYPASSILYKNHLLLKNAIKEIPEQEFRLFITLEENDFDYEDSRVIYLGKIDREDVLKKYRETTLVFPSFIETFGLPLLEARSLKGRILAGNTEFAKEILKGYDNVNFFNMYDSRDLVKKIEKAMGSTYNYSKEKTSSYSDNETLFHVIVSNLGGEDE